MAPLNVAIVGGGLGGLAAALRLARRGHRVTLLEQGERLGGKMNRWEAGGAAFDTGPSLITLPWIFEETFADAGERLADHVELRPVGPLAEYRFPDGTSFAHDTALPAWLAVVQRFEGRLDGFLDFMRLGARLYELSRATFFAQSPGELPSPAMLPALRHLPLRGGFGRYHAVLSRFVRDARLRRMFDRYATYVGSSPYEMPSTLSVIPYVEWAFGGWHVRGGLYRIVEAVAALAARRGADLRVNARVERLLHAGGRVRGVALADGSEHAADAVVFNGDASTAGALADLPGAAPLPPPERSLSGVIWLAALRRPFPAAAHHTVCFSADYDREFDDLFRARQFPEDPTVYISRPAATDPSAAPPGGDALFVMANAPADAEPWNETAGASARAAMLRRLCASGLPDFSADVTAERLITPRTMADAYAMPGGAIYGRHSHGLRRAFRRAPNRSALLRGLYHVGGSAHPGGGTPMVLLSAKIACRLIEQDGGGRG
jgi:phytoene desaturase